MILLVVYLNRLEHFAVNQLASIISTLFELKTIKEIDRARWNHPFNSISLPFPLYFS